MPYIIGVGDVPDNREVTLDLEHPVPEAVRRAVSPEDLRTQLRAPAPLILDERGRPVQQQGLPPAAAVDDGEAYREWLVRMAAGTEPGVPRELSVPVAVTSLMFAPLRPFDVPGAMVGEYLRSRREGTPARYGEAVGRTVLPEVYGAPLSTLAHEVYTRINPEGREASVARRGLAGAAAIGASLAADPLNWFVPVSHVPAVGRMVAPSLRRAFRAASPILEEQVAAAYGRDTAREALRIAEDAFMRAGAARIPSAPELLLHSATGGRLGAAMPTVEQLSARISPTLVATGAQSEVGRVIDAMNEALRALEARGLRPPSMAAEPGALAGSPLGAWAQTVMSGIVHAGRPQWRYWGRPLFPYRGYDPGALGELERAYVRSWGPTAGRTNLERVLQVDAARMEADRTGDPTRFAEVVARITGRPAEQVAEAAGEAAGRERILREVIRTYGGPDTEELTMRLLRRRAAEEVAGGPRAGPRIVDVPFEEEGATAEGGFRTVWNRVTDLLGRFGGPTMREAAATRATAQRVGGDVAQDVGASLGPIAREWAARAEPIVEQALADIQPALENYRAAWALVRPGSDVDIGALGSTPLGTTILELLRENGPMPLGALTAALEQIAVPPGLTERLAQGIRYTVPTAEKLSDYRMGPVVRAYAHEMARAGLLQQWQLPPEAALQIFGNPTDTLIVGLKGAPLLPTEAQLEAARAAAAPAARAKAAAAGTTAAPPAAAPAEAAAAAPPTATGPAGPPSQPPPPPPAAPAAVQPPEPMRLRAGVPLDVRAVIRANLEVLEGRADYLRRLLKELRDPAAAAERERLSQDLAAEGYIREVEAALPRGVRRYFREVARAANRWYGLRPAEVYKLRFGLDNADAASARLAAAVEQALHNVDPRMDAAIGWWGGTEGTHVLRQDLLGMPAGTEYTFPLRDRVTGLLRILGEPLPADAFIEGETLVRERLPRKAQQAIERAEELLRLAELAYEGGPGFPGLAEAGVPRKPSTYWPKLPNLAAANDEQRWLWAMYGLDPEEVLAYTRRGARTSIEQEATYQDQFTRLLAAVEAIRGERAGGAAVSSDSVLRMLPGVSASAAWRDYVRVAHAVVRRQAVDRWLRDMFTSVHEARSVSPGLHEQMAAAGWGPVRITTPGGTVVLPGTEDLLVPPQVQAMVSGLLASPSPHSDAALLERVAHTGRALVYRGAVNMLRTASFGGANLLEQLWNNFAAGVLTDRYGLTAAQATAIFMRVWPEMILQANLGVTQRGLVDIFREAFARAGREVARFLTPYLTDEQARAWAEVMTDLGVTGSGFGVRVASAAAETRPVLVDRVLTSVAGRLGRSVKELGDLGEPLLNAVFSMDAWGRGIAFVGRMLMGDSPEAARAAILRETVEYTRSATIPVEEWLKLFALFVTYARQRAGQVIEHILSYPGLAIGIEEMYRKRQEFIGFSPERVALNGGRPNWMGPEWIETPWSSPLINLPWAKVARPGPMLRAIDGEYALWTRFRIPALEEPGALVDYISRPATGFGQRAYPFRAVRMVEGVGPDKLVKPLARVPVIGPYFQEARRVPLREPDESIVQAVVRRLARTGVSDTAIESLVAREYETLQGITAPMARRKPWSEALSEWARQRHLVPPECRASLQVIRDHGVRAAMQYEIEKLKLYRDLAQFSSRTGIRVFAVPIEDLVNNMTESQLLMGRRAAEESLARGEKPYIMPERYDKELAERREGRGPRNWAEQAGSVWAPLFGAIERAGRRAVERRVGTAGGR